MKRQLCILILLCSIAEGYSQRLGFSSISSYGSSRHQADHSLFSNVGEPLIHRKETASLVSCEGLLHYHKANAGFGNFIRVSFYLDANEDGQKDVDEIYLGLGAFAIQDSILFRNAYKEGVTVQAPLGRYTVSYDESGANGWFLTSSEDVTVTLDEENPVATVSFGIFTDLSLSDVQTFICAAPFRCNTKVNYHMVARNQGYVPVVGTAWLRIDERLADVRFIDEPDVVIDSNYVGWNYVLEPSERQEFYYCLMAPGITSEEMLGEVYETQSWATPTTLDTFRLTEVLRCSYDPNDKLVNPDRPDSLGLLRDEIVYTIRFQNTGNDYAEDVVVTDTISEHLDMSTFQVINTSHSDVFSIVSDRNNARIINFTFENIFLQDSTTNEPASHGFIMYKIRPLQDVVEWTEVNNTAHIFFDFNPAIVTNTTSTTLVEEFPTTATHEANRLEVSLVPNPSSGILYTDKIMDKVELLDLSGRLLHRYTKTNKIDLSAYPDGSYLLDLHLDDSHQVKKIMLMR